MFIAHHRLVLCVLMPLLCLTGPALQLCFCASEDEGSHHGHSHRVSVTEEHHDHGGRNDDSSSDHASIGLDPTCQCFTLSPAPANTKGVERFTKKRDSKPAELVTNSPTPLLMVAHELARTSVPATAGGGHSPPCPIFSIYCSFLI